MTVFGEGFIRVRPETAGFSKEAKEGVLGPVKEIAKSVVGIFAVAGAGEFLKGSVEKAEAAQRATDSLKVSLENQKVSWKDNKGAIDDWVQATSKATAFHTTDITTGLSRLFTATGSVSKAEKDLGIASDYARLRHISLSQAVLAVTGATVGNNRALRAAGIILSPVTAAQDKLKASVADVRSKLADQERAYRETAKTQKLASNVVADHIAALKKSATAQIDDIEAGKKAAVQADKQASGVKNLDELKRRAAGQAAEYAKSEGGAVDRLKNSFDQIQITVGEVLLPTLANLASQGSKYLDELRANFPKIKAEVKSALEPVAPIFNAIKGAVSDVNHLLGGTGNTLRDIGIAVAAFVVISKTIQLATLLWEGLTTAIFLARNAQIAFDVALEANPIGLVVVALTALAAGIYVAYTRSATFRAIVQDAFAVLRTDVLPALNDAKTAIGDFITFVRAHWDQITSIIAPVVKIQFDLAKGYVTATVDEIKGIINLFGDVIHGRWSHIWGDLKNLVTAPLHDVESTVSDILDTIKGAAGDKAEAVAHAIVAGIKTAPGKLAGLAGDLLGKLSSAISEVAGKAFTAAEDIGAQLVHGIVKGIENTPANIGSSLWGVVSGGIHAAKKKAGISSPSRATAEGLGSPLVEGILYGIQHSAFSAPLSAALTDQVTKSVNAARANLSSLSGGIVSSISAIIDAGTARSISALPQKLTAAIAGLSAGTALGDASAKIAKDQADKQERALRATLASANAAVTAGPNADGSGPSAADLLQSQKDAQTDLDDFLLQAQIDKDTAAYNQAVQASNDQNAIAKKTVNDQIGLWTTQFNQGLIDQTTYLADINGLVNDYATGDGAAAWANAGTLLGSSFVASFQGQLATLIQQVNQIAAVGAGGGDGTLGSTTNPADTVISQLKSQTATVAGDKTAIAKAQAALKTAQQKFDAAHDVGSTIAAAGGNRAAIAAEAATAKQLEAAQAALAAAKTTQTKDSAILAALTLLLQKAGIDPAAALAEAAR